MLVRATTAKEVDEVRLLEVLVPELVVDTAMEEVLANLVEELEVAFVLELRLVVAMAPAILEEVLVAAEAKAFRHHGGQLFADR